MLEDFRIEGARLLAPTTGTAAVCVFFSSWVPDFSSIAATDTAAILRPGNALEFLQSPHAICLLNPIYYIGSHCSR